MGNTLMKKLFQFNRIHEIYRILQVLLEEWHS